MDTISTNVVSFLQQNIRCLRKRLGMSQEELASKVGLNRGNVASYENGTAEPKICNLLKFSHLFQISIVDLTQKNLSDLETLDRATTNFQQFSKGEKELLEQFMYKANELEAVLKGINACFHFQAKKVDDLPKELQFLMLNFEQLHEVSQSLMRNHRSLIEFFKCKV
ncbi:MAG: hypothetical protein DHS20C18_13300 [Saprospiraceae bacterium]|nr:MAG: hypothetical protein DHS20C18_13300 [Saprospiraceae bacterium]